MSKPIIAFHLTNHHWLEDTIIRALYKTYKRNGTLHFHYSGSCVDDFYVFKNILYMLLYDIPYIILSYFSYSNLYLMLL
jgi:hypothetical protein